MSGWNVGPVLGEPCRCGHCDGRCEWCERCEGAGYVVEAADETSDPARHPCPWCSEDRDGDTLDGVALDAATEADRSNDEERAA